MSASGPEVHPGPDPSAMRRALYRLGALVLAFVLGGAAAAAARYFLYGKPVQLAPDTFITLVFTVAVGAASLVLALLAISYGRVSERVMTERADKSIEIQMSLLQKSLDLQTQLFDKTMSTLESIGRSTGVTEQRLGDIHSLFQNPTFLKQIAGRAVEETASELNRKGKEGLTESQTDEQLAERLTKNIVRELSTRFEGLEKAVQSSVIFRGGPLIQGTTVRGETERTEEANAEEQERKRRVLALQARRALVQKAIEAIPGLTPRKREKPNTYWDFLLDYKGKTIALDVRMRAPSSGPPHGSYDESIKVLFSDPIDCIVFVFPEAPGEEFVQQIEQRNKILQGRLRYVVGQDEATLQNELVALLESVAAALPSPE